MLPGTRRWRRASPQAKNPVSETPKFPCYAGNLQGNIPILLASGSPWIWGRNGHNNQCFTSKFPTPAESCVRSLTENIAKIQ